MKALSIKQPWASLIANGTKTMEVRTWRTDYRGPLLVCASQQPDRQRGSDYLWWPHMHYATGVAVCLVDLVDIVPGRPHHQPRALVDPTGAFCWVLRNPRLVAQEPVKGRLGLFTPPASVVQRLRAA